MPQYVFNIGGQRHVFEGPDPQTTAQFAQRWAAQEAGRTPVTVADIQRRLGTKPSQFATDIGSRARDDVSDLTGAIADVKAHPTSLLNGPKILSAVARYIPNALGLAPAAGVDQVTGPAVRGVNTRFGTHYDPHDATDQILNAAGVLTGNSELSGIEGLGALDKERLNTLSGKLRDLDTPRVAPKLQAVPSAPKPPPLSYHVLGQNAAGENVVPLSDGFVLNHQNRMKSMEDLPEHIQDKYHDTIGDLILNPILDDPDYGGHNSAAIMNIRDELSKMAAQQRRFGGSPRLADAFDGANEDFRVMVNEQQPQMAEELRLTGPGGASPAASPAVDPDATPSGAPAKVYKLEHHFVPPDSSEEPVDLFSQMTPERRRDYTRTLYALVNTANDNEPLPQGDGFVRVQRPLNFPMPEDFDLKQPGPKLTPEETTAWMKTAANDNLGWRPRAYGVRQTLMNAFTDPVSLGRAIAAGTPNLLNTDNFNALRPPGLAAGSILAAQQPSQQ